MRYLVYPEASKHVTMAEARARAKQLSTFGDSRIADTKTNTHVAFYRYGKLVSDKPIAPKTPKPLTDAQRTRLVFGHR